MLEARTRNGTACCGRPARRGERACPLCHRPFADQQEQAPAATPAAPPATPAPAAAVRTVRTTCEDEERVLGIPGHWFFLLAGLATAPVFAVLPLVSLIGWFLAAIAHEMGHSIVSWTFGMPAFPAISLTAEAASIHGEPILLARVVVLVGLLYAAGLLATRPARLAARVGVFVLYPLGAFTGLGELLHLLGGHLGELVLGGVFLWRALDGGFSSSAVERGLYGTTGWYLVGRNVFLTLGLAFSGAARARYQDSGSFGMRNDYLRVAEDALGVPLEGVALAATLLALSVAPVTVLAWRARAGRASP